MQTSESADRAEVVNALCRTSFDFFAQKAFSLVEPHTPYEWNWHLGCVAEHLTAVRTGEIEKLIINIPPRTLKSFLVCQAFPAWVMGLDKGSRFICASYGSGLAEANSVRCRDIVTSDWYRETFQAPNLRRDHNHKNDWRDEQDGGYFSSGIEGGITGRGAHYVILDDPVKPNEALSDTIRNNTNAAIRNTAFSRFNDPRKPKFILVMQRLHEDDPTGHLLQSQGYHLLSLPAETKKPVLITLGKKHWTMKDDSLLFPQRLTRKVLDGFRDDLKEYNYAAQYLMSPVPIGGGELKHDWVQYYRGAVKPREMNIYILVDPAGGEELQKKKKKLSDRTTMMVIGLAPDKNYYWLDGICDRLNPTERVDALFELHRKWADLSGKPPKVGYEQYGIQTDTHYIRKKQEETTYRFSMVELGGRMEKNERIRRLIPDLQIGRWWFPVDMIRTDYMGRAIDLVRELVKSEMPTFPKARYDDMLDAISRIYDADLNAIFPAVKSQAAQKYRGAPEPQGWLDS